MKHGATMKKNDKQTNRYRMSVISAKEIKDKYPDKLVDAYVENERLVLVLDTCKIKYDERVPQYYEDKYGAIH